MTLIPLLIQAIRCIGEAEEMSNGWIDLDNAKHHAAGAWDHCLMVIWHTRSWPGLYRDDEGLKLMARTRAHETITVLARAGACLGISETWKYIAVSAIEGGAADWMSVKMGAYQVQLPVLNAFQSRSVPSSPDNISLLRSNLIVCHSVPSSPDNISQLTNHLSL